MTEWVFQAGKPAVWQLKAEEFPKVPLSQEPKEEHGAGEEGKRREGGGQRVLKCECTHPLQLCHLLFIQEDDGGQEEVECPEQTMTEGPVDFTTVKCEEEEQTKEEMDGVQPDMSDMAAFIASATAAVRNAGGNSFQVISTVPPSQPPSTTLNSPL